MAFISVHSSTFPMLIHRPSPADGLLAKQNKGLALPISALPCGPLGEAIGIIATIIAEAIPFNMTFIQAF